MKGKECNDQELEIDLIELCRELKKNIVLIIAATVLCATAAGAYIHFMTIPRYAYSRMIKLPETETFRISDQDKFSYVNILKLDTNNPALWKDSSKGRLVSVDLVREKNINTNLITFQFEGSDPVYLKKAGDEYLDRAVQKLNASLKEIKDANLNNRYLNTLINDELKGIRSALAKSSVSGDTVQQSFTDLEKRLNEMEKNEYFTAKATENANASATRISNKPIIKKSAALGFVLSILFVTGRYCLKKAKESGMI